MGSECTPAGAQQFLSTQFAYYTQTTRGRGELARNCGFGVFIIALIGTIAFTLKHVEPKTLTEKIWTYSGVGIAIVVVIIAVVAWFNPCKANCLMSYRERRVANYNALMATSPAESQEADRNVNELGLGEGGSVFDEAVELDDVDMPQSEENDS
jgi:Na+/melibiose symporter-like transporter